MLRRALAAEFIATGLLLAIVVGSGVMGDRLSSGNAGIALLANSLATGARLVALILAFGPVSGAHMNPAVTLAAAATGGIPWRSVAPYVAVQVCGAFAGVAAAHAMFSLPLWSASTNVRAGTALAMGELVATFALVLVVLRCGRARPDGTPYAVGAIIVAGYWFTSSTSFANPAVTVARAATDTFTGLRPADALPFLAAQLLGAAASVVVFRFVSTPSGPTGRSKLIVFACVHNAGRSQMAAAFFNQLADPARACAVSAGTEPADQVHSEVVAAMREVGVDLTAVKPTKLAPALVRDAFLLVTMGCGEACPAVPGVQREDWPFPDPKGRDRDAVRGIRDAIRLRVAALVHRHGVGYAAARPGPVSD